MTMRARDSQARDSNNENHPSWSRPPSGAALLAALLLAGAPMAGAAPGSGGPTIEVGHGSGVVVYGVGYAWPDSWIHLTDGSRDWSTRWIAKFENWHAENDGPRRRDLVRVGLMPVVRYQSGGRGSWYLEGGIGASLLSATALDNRRLSTAFQFNEMIGVGMPFGERGHYEVSVSLNHVSNGDIKKPNNGFSYGAVSLGYVF